MPTLINETTLALAVVNRKLGQFVMPAAVSVALVTPSWELDESRTFWVAQAETAAISINNTEPSAVAGLKFTARANVVSLSTDADLDQSIESALNGAIAAIQISAAATWLSGLENFPMPPGANLEPDTEIGVEPRLAIRVRFSGENLIPREYSATWDRNSRHRGGGGVVVRGGIFRRIVPI